MSKSGYYDYHYDAGSYFTIGDYITVNAVLTPIPTNGYLSISSSPSGAIVYVDGIYKGTSPLPVTLPAGSHSIQMSMSGYNSWSGSTNVNVGQTTSVSASLTPSVTYDYLSVSSSPSNADVYINGVYKGDTSFTIGLNPGTYQVMVKKSGYTSIFDYGDRQHRYDNFSFGKSPAECECLCSDRHLSVRCCRLY